MKLTKAQLVALRAVSEKNGFFSPWALGTRTCEALRKRGLLEGTKPFDGHDKHDSRFLWITDAGRRALAEGGDG